MCPRDLQGNVIAKATEEYQLITPNALSVEMEVEIYWQAFKTAIARVLHLLPIQPTNIKRWASRLRAKRSFL